MINKPFQVGTCVEKNNGEKGKQRTLMRGSQLFFFSRITFVCFILVGVLRFCCRVMGWPRSHALTCTPIPRIFCANSLKKREKLDGYFKIEMMCS